MKYSIIVTVYNLEKYIVECVNSLLNQTYTDIEIVIVDDESTDSSLDICNELAGKDSRIKVISKQHGGVSEARNEGIRQAKGEYVLFLDGDDFIVDDYIYNVNEIICTKNPDILITNHYYLYNNETGKKVEREMFPLTLEVKEKKIHILDYIMDNHYVIPGGVSFNVYRREFLLNESCFFQEKIQWFEDLDFFLQVISKKPSYEVTDVKYYFYRKNRKGSAVSSVTTQKIVDKMSIIRKWYSYIERISENEPFYKVKYWLQREYYVNFAFCVPCNGSEVDYPKLTEIVLQDKNIWIDKYPNFGKNVERYGLKKIIPFIKLKEYSKVIFGIR